MKRLLPRGEFGRNVLTVLSGATIAQVIPVLVSPLLTRLYTPADLGGLALFVAVVTVLVVLATGRYELAILLPRSERTAFDLAAIAAGLAVMSCGAGMVITVMFLDRIASTLALGSDPWWLYFVPPCVMMMGVYQALNYWYNRRGQYRMLAGSRVAQASTMCSVQVAAGGATGGALGLIGGYAAGQAASIAVIVRATRSELLLRLRAVRVARLRIAARRYRSFPIYMVPGHLANIISAQAPVLLLATLYGPAVAGLYSLAERVLVAPTSIVGAAIGDVYRQQAALAYQRAGNCRELFLRTARRLFLIALVPLVLSVVGGPVVFELVFGVIWRPAGEIVALLGAMIFFQLISSPLSQTVLLAGMQQLDLVWQLLRLALAFASIYAGFVLDGGYLLSIGLYAVSQSLLHVMHSVMQYRAACGSHASIPTKAV